MNYPKISIITPSFNQASYIEKTIQSILSQGYPNLEYIIIDGGSTDGSVEIIKKYEKQLAYWVSEKDKGQSDAINKGLALCSGKIFNWINSDDYLEPESLFRIAEEAEKHPDAAAWVAGCNIIKENGELLRTVYPNGLTYEHIGNNWNGRNFYQPACFINLEYLREAGGIREDLHYCMDFELYLRLLKNNHFIAAKGIWANALRQADAKTVKALDDTYKEVIMVQNSYGFTGGAKNRYDRRFNGGKLEYVSPGADEIIPDLYKSSNYYKILIISSLSEDKDKEKINELLSDILPGIIKRNSNTRFDLWFNFDINFTNNQLIKVCNYNEVINNLEEYRAIIISTSLTGIPSEMLTKAKKFGIPFITSDENAASLGCTDGCNGFVFETPGEAIEKCLAVFEDAPTWGGFRFNLLNKEIPGSLSKRKKIIIIQGGFPSVSATFIMDQMTGLIRAGFEIENWSTYRIESDVEHPDVKEYGLMSRTRYIKVPPEVLRSNTDEWVKEFFRINNLSEPDDVSAFHVHYGANFNLLEPLFRKYSQFVLVSFHGYDASKYFKERGDNCYAYLYQRANLITTPSLHMKNELTRRGCSDEKVKIHRYGIDLKKFDISKKQKNKDKVVFLTVGRFVEKKGIEYSLKAFAKICRNVNVEYRIVGEGKLESKYREIIKENKIEDCVVFTGPKTKEEVAFEMESADVFVLTSVTASDGDCEGVPVSLTEAHAAGLPVVSTYHAGIPELVIHEKTGLLSAERDSDKIAEHMFAFACSEKMRVEYSLNARRRAEEEFDIKKLNETLCGYLSGTNTGSSFSGDLNKLLSSKKWESRYNRYSEYFEYSTVLNEVNNPAVSVVILSLKMNANVLKNFQLLQEQRKTNFEIVFVNNGASESEFEQLKPFINTYIKLNKNTGAYLARNIGALFTKADILLFLDDDALPANDFVQMHLRLQKANKDIAAIRGKCLPLTEGAAAPHYDLGETPVPYYSNLEGNLSVKADVFFKVGGFSDDIIFGYGGAEFSYRLKKYLDAPEPAWYFPQAVIQHDYIKDEQHAAVKKQRQEESLRRIISVYSDFELYMQYYRNLIKNMPAPEIVKAGDESLFNNDILKVNWVVTRKCNYQCSYCKVYDNKNGFFVPLEKLKAAVDQIKELNKDKYVITITGGEPTIHPSYIEFIRYIYEKLGDKASVTTITNLSRTKAFYESFSKEIAPHKNSFFFQASYHFEFTKPEAFINNAGILADNDINLNISILSHPERMDEVRELHSGLKKLNPAKIRSELILVRENYGTLPDKRYSAADLVWLQDKYQSGNYKPVLIDRYYENTGMAVRSYYTAAELNIKGLHEYKGMICSAGDKMISIDQFGNVSPAVCFRGAKQFSANVYEGKGSLSAVKNVVCPFDRCGCVADLQLPKYSSKEKTVKSKINNSQKYSLKDKLSEKNWLHKLSLYEPVFESAEVQNKVEIPEASVVVISWRLHPDTIRNFEVLHKQRNQNFELIFVENGGRPGEFDALKPYVDTYVKLNKNTGAYLARNIGSLFASAPLLIFLEDDGIPEANFIKAHLDCHRKYDIIALRGVYSPKTANPYNNYAAHYYLGPEIKSIYVDVEGNASYRADIFYKAGGWDDNINFGGGGPELALRLLDIEPDKRKQIYTPEAIIYHDYATDEKHFASKKEKQRSSGQYLRGKHSNWDIMIHSWNEFMLTDSALPVEKNKTYDEATRIYDSNIKISVCVPTFNRSAYLKEALNSVLVQQGNYEIVVVDDGSTDDTENAVKSLNSGKIRYFKNSKNMGRSYTRNRCVKEASGDYILWLDDDDLFMPFLLQEYFRILNDDPSVDVIYGNLQSFDNETGKDLIFFSANDYTNSNKEILKNIIDGSGITNLGSAIKKSLFEKYGLYDPEFVRAQDNEFWTRIAPYAKFRKLNKTIARYRKHNSNVSIGGFIDTTYESKIIRKILNRFPLSLIYPAIQHDEAIYAAAMGLYKFGDFYNALKILDNLEDKYKTEYLSLYFDCLINQGHYEVVIKFNQENASVAEAVAAAKQKAAAFRNLKKAVDEAFKRNDLKAVHSAIQPAINHASNNFDVLFSLAKILAAAGDRDSAKIYLKTALKFNPLSKECLDLLLSVIGGKKEKDSVINSRQRQLEEIPMYNETDAGRDASPLVSVIITTYNRKDKLPAAIDSVLKQTYTNIEVIVVNDAGEDVSGIINSFNDNRIKLITHKENKGLPAARNTGIRESSGKYIALLDDDDIFYPDHIKTAVLYLNENCSVVYTDAARQEIIKQGNTEREAGKTIPYSIDFSRNKLLIANIAPVNCFVFEKALLGQSGYFNEELPVLEDWEFWIRLSSVAEFKHVKKTTVQVNWYNDGSTMTSSKGEKFEQVRNIIHQKYQQEIMAIPNKQEIVAEFNAIWKNDFKTEPVVSIIALTYNQVDYTKAFIESVLHNTSVPFELILIDNNSSDNTPRYLDELAASNKNIKVILNKANLGFPKGINQGIKAASGKYILVANNDILVTENWLNRMVEAAESNDKAGLVGPVSNSVSGVQLDKEAKYSTVAEMFNYARKVSMKNKGKMFEFPRIAFLCTLIKKEVIEKIGGLDERFSPGNFEDDDFCLRAQLAGYKTLILQDVFIHHFGSKSFTAEGNQKYISRLETNKKKFIDKWGADPEEIWLRGKSIKKRNPVYPINKNNFIECFDRAIIQIEEKEYRAAEESLIQALKFINEKGNSPVTSEDINNLLGNLSLLQTES